MSLSLLQNEAKSVRDMIKNQMNKKSSSKLQNVDRIFQ